MPKRPGSVLWIIPSALSVVAAQDVGSIQAKLGDMEVQAKISPKIRRLPSGQFRVSAKIIVINHGTQALPFSTRDLFLRARTSQTARAYLNSIASNAIDFSSVQIEPDNPHTYSVYWILDLPEPPKIEILEIFLGQSYDAAVTKH